MTDDHIPRRIIPERGQYVCPGSIFTPTTDGRCLCGQEKGAHVWFTKNGVVSRVPAEEQNAYLTH